MTSVLPGIYINPIDNVTPITVIIPTECFMIGLAGTSPVVSRMSAPFRVTTVAEFTENFGADSPSLPDVQSYFNNTNAPLNFVAIDETLNVGSQHVNYASAMDLLPDNSSGILVMPRAFTTDPLDIDFTALATAVINTQSRTGLYVIIDIPEGSSVADAVTFISGVSPMTDTSVYFPYLTQDGSTIPPSSAMAALTLKVVREESISQVPAGLSFPLRGVSVSSLSMVDKESLYNVDINVIETLRGSTVAMGARTLNKRLFVNTALILSSLRFTLSAESQSLLFSPIDNRGQMFNKAQGLFNRIMYQYYAEGALIGTTPRDAYTIICDNTNNTQENLNAGILYATIELRPSSSVEKVIITPRINISEV